MTLWLSLLLVSSCVARDQRPHGYTQGYYDALARSGGAACAVADEHIHRFIELYSPLNEAGIEQKTATVYADNLYFNDTLVTLHDRAALQAYLQSAAERLAGMSLAVDDIIRHGEDIYLRWRMRAVFKVLGRERISHTIGISQLRFNQAGEVIFHQDFWDSSLGMDQHLPVIGAVTRWLRHH